jgi:hypothetical protein
METTFTNTLEGYESQFRVSFVKHETPTASPILLTCVEFIDRLPFTLALDLLSTADNG